MNLVYLTEDTAPSDALHAVLAQADALIGRGHDVRIVTKGQPLTWRGSQAAWVYVDDFREYDAGDDDFVIGTSGSTVSAAYAMAGKRVVHLCHEYGSIEETGALPIPKLVVSRPLIEYCRRFIGDVTYIGQIVEDEYFRTSGRQNEPLRVLLSGDSQAEEHGVDDGYGAVAHARWFHQKLDLIRVSAWAPSREEPLESVQEFHVGLTSAEMTRLLHSCDVLIAPSHRDGGLGFPAAEALASGLPCVLTSIPSYLSFDERHDYAHFAPEANAVELGERLIEVLSDRDLRDRLRVRGREVAEQWRVERVVERLERFFEERRAKG